MTKRNLFINVVFLLIAIIFSAIPLCSCALSDKRLCYDRECSEPVSLARTTIRYIPNEPGLLPFEINVEVKVYSKEAGNRTDLWGVEINGKRGYVPKHFLKEYKILHKNLQYEMPTNQLPNDNNVSDEKLQPKKDNDEQKFDAKNIEASNTQVDNLNLNSTDELSDNVTNDAVASYKIKNETIFHLDNNESITQPSFVKQVVQTTVVPNEQDDVDNASASSTSKKIKSNIFATNDKLLKNLSDKIENNVQHFPKKADIKDFVTSSEEILDTPEIVGIHVPQLNVNASLENNVLNETIDSNITAEITVGQYSEELSNINVPKMSIPNYSKVALNKVVSNTNANNNSVIKLEEEDNINSTEAVAINNVKTDTEIVQSITKSETKHTESLESETQLKIEHIELKEGSGISEENFTQNNNTDKHVPSLLVESNVNDTEGITDEHILNDTLETTFGELSTPNSIESTEVKITSDTTVSPTSQEAVQNIEEDNITIITNEEDNSTELQRNIEQYEGEHLSGKEISETENEIIVANDILENDTNEHINVRTDSQSTEMPYVSNEFHALETGKQDDINSSELLYPHEKNTVLENVSINEFHDTNPLNIDTSEQFETENVTEDKTNPLKDEALPGYEHDATAQDKVLFGDPNNEDIVSVKEGTVENIVHEVQVSPPDVCAIDNVECSAEDNIQNYFTNYQETSQNSEYPIMEVLKLEGSHWSTLTYLSITATAALIFSLGYYYIENMRRDGQLIARINKLEKDLLISNKECTILNENLKLTKDKLTSIEDESFGSNEMVLSLKAELEASQNIKAELEDQIAMLEKDLESATEAGLELERMLREVLSSDNEVNPLAQSVEDLQTRLNVQQAANESLTNALNLKTQELEFDKLENESLTAELTSFKQKYEELEVELTQVTENLKTEKDNKNSLEQTLTNKVQQLEMQIREISTEKVTLQKELKGKEVEIKDLMDVINRLNTNNLDLDKLYDVSHVKAEATALLEERNELKERLAEVEGAHSLLEEHMTVVKEEVATLSEQCKVAEKEKKDAETRLEVLSNFFKEKEAQRQKEEAIWLQQQGEVVSTVERIQTMQNEIQNYKQQIEMLKREILDQEREYKNQISLLETKAHEQWVVARQVERRLEESKVEAGQLRNRLTRIEKNINDVDSEVKLHRLETNGETATSPPLFLGAESSSSPILFSGSTNVHPPPPPSYLHSLFPPYLPPPLPNASGVPQYEVSPRPPPLGGRLSSPPPMPLHPSASSRYDNNAGSPPPPMSPHLLPPFDHRSPPLPFGSDHIHPPPLPPPVPILLPPLGTTHSWGEESLPHPRNSGFHPPQRERVRNHKGSLHSSGESLDKTHHNSKV